MKDKPHYFINEDGIRYWHEGYIKKKCACGRLFIVGKNVSTFYEACEFCEDKALP